MLSWAVTFAQLTAMMILVRMNSWADGWLMLGSFATFDLSSDWAALPARVPVWVPLLVFLVALGHLCGKLKTELSVNWELPSPVRAAGYVAAVFALVTLTPGVTKTFIYVQF